MKNLWIFILLGAGLVAAYLFTRKSSSAVAQPAVAKAPEASPTIATGNQSIDGFLSLLGPVLATRSSGGGSTNVNIGGGSTGTNWAGIAGAVSNGFGAVANLFRSTEAKAADPTRSPAFQQALANQSQVYTPAQMNEWFGSSNLGIVNSNVPMIDASAMPDFSGYV